MRKLLEILILSLLTLSAVAAIPEGYFVDHDKLIKDYRIEKQYNPNDFLTYMLSENPAVPTEQVIQIAYETITLAECFKVDAKLFVALMRMESNFDMTAISHTGAVGLTQFTSIGAQEVSDQLGERGPRYANSRNTNYLNDIIGNCTDQWQQLWLRERGWSNQKELFLEDVQLSIVYGMILLKVFLAKNYEQDLMDNYYQALVDYNGEPEDRKYWYARTILKFYDEI